MTTAVIYGPWPAGSTGTVTVLENQITHLNDSVTAHIFKGRLYYTVIKV